MSPKVDAGTIGTKDVVTRSPIQKLQSAVISITPTFLSPRFPDDGYSQLFNRKHQIPRLLQFYIPSLAPCGTVYSGCCEFQSQYFRQHIALACLGCWITKQ